MTMTGHACPPSRRPPRTIIRQIIFACLGWCLPWLARGAAQADEPVVFTVTPAAIGRQLIRTALPLPRGFLVDDGPLAVIEDGATKCSAALRVISWYPAADGNPRSVRRALITFVYQFADSKPVTFTWRKSSAMAANASGMAVDLPVNLSIRGGSFNLDWGGGLSVDLASIGPLRTSTEAPRLEVVERNSGMRWERLHFPDPLWPRVIEYRIDAAGGAVFVAHLQRMDKEDGFAPTMGWAVSGKATDVQLAHIPAQQAAGRETVCHWGNTLDIYHPTARLKKGGGMETVQDDDSRSTYRYLRCQEDDRVPMQPMSWRRVEIVIAPPALARLTTTLASPHRVKVPVSAWRTLYDHLSLPADYPQQLESAIDYHRDAIARSAAAGNDWGNVTGFLDDKPHGPPFGMNRLNHCAPIFEEGWRTGDRRLIDTALAWCDNFYDLSIWWGDPQRGGTRYNNVAAMGREPLTTNFMWRSNNSVHFCTKGYDAFWLAWEETGDPRMLEAFRTQVEYAASNIFTDRGECRNIGDVRDFVRLYGYTGERRYLDEALRLFRELRTKLSKDHLFDQGGKPITPVLPFIDDDATGSKVGFVKPYIVGYALAGLPELLKFAPDEPGLKETVRAVADFLAATVDPSGGWRYPHPRSSKSLPGQGLEHAWQLAQAARALGPEPRWLDAIATVLRARILAFQRTGLILNAIEGFEISTGKVKDSSELPKLYATPSDRNAARDYDDGRLSYGYAPPEGLVYFTDVLAYYLEHRPADSLLAPPPAGAPLELILRRSPTRAAQPAATPNQLQPTNTIWKAGTARVKITPEKPMWMAGYGYRDHPAEGKLTDLWAKAIALEDRAGRRAVLVTLDLLGLDRTSSTSIFARLEKRYGLRRDQVNLCASHTHSGPVVGHNLGPVHFEQVDAAQHALILAYARRLEDNIVKIVGDALEALAPATLAWGNGQTDFAVNRRTNWERAVPELRAAGKLQGPVDHDVPVLAVRDQAERLLAMVFGYACHATVLGAYEWNGDYPGYAQAELEAKHPNVTALFWAGCGADQNPLPRRTVELAREYGRKLAGAVEDVLTASMRPVSSELQTAYREIELPFGPLPSAEQIKHEAQSEDATVAARARMFQREIDAGRSLRPTYPYPIAQWRLGDEISWIFLGGEVVVDYALRLKAGQSGNKTWIAAYANDVMAYIPSTRVLNEGGYEGGGAMVSYGLPAPWSAEVESLIVGAIDKMAKDISF